MVVVTNNNAKESHWIVCVVQNVVLKSCNIGVGSIGVRAGRTCNSSCCSAQGVATEVLKQCVDVGLLSNSWVSLDSCNFTAVCIGGDVKDVWILLKDAVRREGSTICREGHGKVLLLPVCVQINGIGTCRNSQVGVGCNLVTSTVCLGGPALEGFTCNIEIIVEVVDLSVRTDRYRTASIGSNAINNRDAVAIVVSDVEPRSVSSPVWIDRHVRSDLGISGELVLGTSSVGVVPAVKLLTTCIRICRQGSGAVCNRRSGCKRVATHSKSSLVSSSTVSKRWVDAGNAWGIEVKGDGCSRCPNMLLTIT